MNEYFVAYAPPKVPSHLLEEDVNNPQISVDLLSSQAMAL
jgi:hypothetical protein